MRNTETMTVPVIVGWKCRECGRKNAVRTDMTAEYSDSAPESWAGSALNVIINPGNFSRALRECIDTDECKCPQCGNSHHGRERRSICGCRFY